MGNCFYMRVIIPALLFLILTAGKGQAQDALAVDSMELALKSAKTPSERVYWLDFLSRTLMNVNPAKADSVGKILIEYAEETRDRKLMVKAYTSNGIRCGYFAGNINRARQAISYYETALNIARESKMEEETGGVQLRLAAVHLLIPDRDKALSYVNQANTVISTLKNDSLKAECYNVYGYVYLARNEKIQALRNFHNALRIAEETKNPQLLQGCYQHLSKFYAGIEDYDKAIDYAVKAYEQFSVIHDKAGAYQRVISVNSIGKLFASKKSHDIAISYFERSLAMADSLNFSSLKMPAYLSILNQYLQMDQPRKALDYFNSPRGRHLQAQLRSLGLAPTIDQAYGIIYTSTGQYDSARIYLDRAEPYFEKNVNETNKIFYYSNRAELYKKTGENSKAIQYFLLVKELSEKHGILENIQMAARELDSLYAKTGDYQLSRQYNSIYNQVKDSIATLSREKELAQEEASDEQLRMERLQKEKQEQARRRNNIQYLAITFSIVGLFILLVVLGMFKVSAGAIRAIGFFAFLLFFEFIFLLFKKNIYSITNGEPWKDLAFMIALAALLVPVHHWMEKKVLNYLTSHNRLTMAGRGLKQRIFNKTRSQ